MVMGTPPAADCTASYRTGLSSERMPYMKNNKVNVFKRKDKD
jgi:hypothetical protein